MGNHSTAAPGALRVDEETLKGLLDAGVDSICRPLQVSCLTDTPERAPVEGALAR